MRTQLIDLFMNYGADVNSIYCEAPFRAALQRNAKRSRPIPDAAIHRMADKLEVPKAWEAVNTVYHLA